MSFYNWMMQKYLKKDTWRGDLARDMKEDKNFPVDGEKESILEHLKNRHACSECIDVFKKCWRDYERAGN